MIAQAVIHDNVDDSGGHSHGANPRRDARRHAPGVGTQPGLVFREPNTPSGRNPKKIKATVLLKVQSSHKAFPLIGEFTLHHARDPRMV